MATSTRSHQQHAQSLGKGSSDRDNHVKNLLDSDIDKLSPSQALVVWSRIDDIMETNKQQSAALKKKKKEMEPKARTFLESQNDSRYIISQGSGIVRMKSKTVTGAVTQQLLLDSCASFAIGTSLFKTEREARQFSVALTNFILGNRSERQETVVERERTSKKKKRKRDPSDMLNMFDITLNNEKAMKNMQKYAEGPGSRIRKNKK